MGMKAAVETLSLLQYDKELEFMLDGGRSVGMSLSTDQGSSASEEEQT